MNKKLVQLYTLLNPTLITPLSPSEQSIQRHMDAGSLSVSIQKWLLKLLCLRVHKINEIMKPSYSMHW